MTDDRTYTDRRGLLKALGLFGLGGLVGASLGITESISVPDDDEPADVEVVREAISNAPGQHILHLDVSDWGEADGIAYRVEHRNRFGPGMEFIGRQSDELPTEIWGFGEGDRIRAWSVHGDWRTIVLDRVLRSDGSLAPYSEAADD